MGRPTISTRAIRLGKALRREYLHPLLLRTSELLDLSAYGFAREPCPKLPGADRYD